MARQRKTHVAGTCKFRRWQGHRQCFQLIKPSEGLALIE
jgi:hypothetical protein